MLLLIMALPSILSRVVNSFHELNCTKFWPLGYYIDFSLLQGIYKIHSLKKCFLKFISFTFFSLKVHPIYHEVCFVII